MYASQKKQIRNLLAVLGASIAAAGIISSWMLYHYNPSGNYYAQNVLLAPQLIGNLTYQELDPKGGKKGRVLFENIEFKTPDGLKEQTYLVAPDLYEKFYNEIAKEQSMNPVSEEAFSAFHQGRPSKLILKIQNNGAKETLQEVHFAPTGDFYRVQLREQGEDTGWAYYYHPGILEKVTRLFKT